MAIVRIELITHETSGTIVEDKQSRDSVVWKAIGEHACTWKPISVEPPNHRRAIGATVDPEPQVGARRIVASAYAAGVIDQAAVRHAVAA